MLFEDEVGETPGGESYATVVNSRLSELLKRDRIVALLTNPDEVELIEQIECINYKPSISGTGGFVFFVHGDRKTYKILDTDRLALWEDTAATKDVRMSEETRLRFDQNNHLQVSKAKLALDHNGFTLYENTATLARCRRHNKKVVYVLRNGHQYGHGLIMYQYVKPGAHPDPLHQTVQLMTDAWFDILPPDIRMVVYYLLKYNHADETARIVHREHSVYLSRMKAGRPPPPSTSACTS